MSARDLRQFRNVETVRIVVKERPAWLGPVTCRVCGATIQAGSEALYRSNAVGGMEAHTGCGFETATEKARRTA